MSILVQYVEDILTPTDSQIKFINSKAKSIRNVLTRNSSLTPKEVHIGGSFKKGTMLKHKLDADLIYVYNRSEDVGKNWRKLTTIIYKVLKNNFPEVEIEEAGNLAIHIKTSLENRQVNFDVVPCYYVNSPKMMKEHIGSKLYVAITTIWHTRFLMQYKNSPYFTHIVRLLKDWKNEHDVPLKNIHLELLVADVYDNIIEDFNNVEINDILRSCFTNILDALEGYSVIPSNWKYCDVHNYERQYNFPVLIDPANPSDNLLKNLTENEIKKIVRKTKITMENLNEHHYADIFNRKRQTDFFD